MSENNPEVSRPLKHRRRALVVAGAVGLAGATLVAGCSLGGARHHDNTVDVLHGQWAMPGATLHKDGLHVAHRDFKIVEQDGSSGQANPPVNVAGTHLERSGDFTVNAAFQGMQGEASLSMHGTVPMVSDEFRVEGQHVDMTVQGGNLTVQAWDGLVTDDLSHQQPVAEQAFPLPEGGQGSTAIAMTDQGGQLTFSAGGRELGHMPDHNIFGSGRVYFGANAASKRGGFILSKLTAQGLHGGKVTTADIISEKPFAKDPNGLQSLASKKRPGFLLGSDAALWATTDNSYRKMIFGGNFGVITPENEMKWEATEPQPGVYDFHNADALVELAHKNGMKVWGHNLVFSEALPKWVQDLPTGTPEQKDHVRRVMAGHITALVTHFRGKVIGWDVVNEPIKDYDDFDAAQPYRENVFYRAMGADYIRIALEAARKADPDAKLGINEFGFSGLMNGADDERATAIYTILKDLKDKGASPDVFGDQAHIYDPGQQEDAIVNKKGRAPVLERRIRQVHDLGMQYRISEADAPAAPSTDYDGSSQMQQLTGETKICLEHPACIGFTMWSTGMTDFWKNDDGRLEKSVDSPVDQNNRPNGTYKALQDALR